MSRCQKPESMTLPLAGADPVPQNRENQISKPRICFAGVGGAECQERHSNAPWHTPVQLRWWLVRSHPGVKRAGMDSCDCRLRLSRSGAKLQLDEGTYLRESYIGRHCGLGTQYLLANSMQLIHCATTLQMRGYPSVALHAVMAHCTHGCDVQ